GEGVVAARVEDQRVGVRVDRPNDVGRQTVRRSQDRVQVEGDGDPGRYQHQRPGGGHAGLAVAAGQDEGRLVRLSIDQAADALAGDGVVDEGVAGADAVGE